MMNNNQTINMSPEKIANAFYGEGQRMEQKAKECEVLGNDETIPSSCRVGYMEKSIAFRDLAKEIYNICSPINQPAHV